MKKLFFLGLLIFIVNCALSQAPIAACNNDTLILWSSDRPLERADFMTIRDRDSLIWEGNIAMAQSYIKFELITDVLGKIKWPYLLVHFDRHKSFLSTVVDSLTILHEQVHFDIAELQVRKLRKQLFQLQQIGELNNDIYMILSKKIMQIQYDQIEKKYHEEVLKSAYFETQKLETIRWKEEIANQLDSLKEYDQSNYCKELLEEQEKMDKVQECEN